MQWGVKAAVGGWLGGGTVGQSIVNGTLTVCPVITVTGREVPPLTEQLDWIPLSVTVWFPVARPGKVTESFVPIALLPPLFTVTV